MAERNDELLSSFNVATFKSDEDDQAFWNRLIPVDQRVKDQPEAQEHLGIRTARLNKFAEDVRMFTLLLCMHASRPFQARQGAPGHQDCTPQQVCRGCTPAPFAAVCACVTPFPSKGSQF